MDVLQEAPFAGPEHCPSPPNTTDNDSHDQLSDESHALRHHAEPDVLAPPTLGSSSRADEVPLSVVELHDESVSNAASVSSLSSFSSLSSLSSLSSVSCSKPVTPWSVPQSCDRPPLSSMDSGGGDCLSCMIPKNQSCESVLGLTPEFQSCPATNISMQCLSAPPNVGRYGEQVLSDQLLSGSTHAAGVNENAEEGKSMRESESDDDPASRSIYESLGEEAQDWSCLESLISESRMELLDLCSRSELAVNLFCEEDVENYMFQEEESTLGTDVCSLKIRYESYPDGAQERTEPPLQDESQLGFFPALPCNRAEGIKEKADQSSEDKTDAPTTPNSNFLFDLSNSPEDSGEFSDDSYCTGSSPDAWQAQRTHGQLSRENSSSSSQLSYRLRAKRKVAFREDYLYDVDSIESEKNAEKREKPSVGPKKERDDDWCPKKRRRSCRKEPPVIIKYIIINRFKGEKHMQVRLSRVDPSIMMVHLSPDTLLHYERLAPLKAYWQKKEKEQQELNKLAVADKTKRLNGCKRPPSANLKRKQRSTSRLRIQRIHAVESSTPSQTAVTLSINQQEKSESVKSTEPQEATAHDALDKVETCGKITHPARTKSRTEEREERRKDGKIAKIKKFKSEARLRSKKLKEAQKEENSTASELTELSSCLPGNLSNSLETNVITNETSVEKCTLSPSVPGTNGNVGLLPGGYLQTLLEASDSSSSANVTYFPSDQQQPGLLPVAAPLQPAQTCVLSPPSESELPHSPQPLNHIAHHAQYPDTNQTEQNYPITWPSQPTVEQLSFSPDIPTQSPVMPSGFPRPITVLAGDNATVTGYSPVPLGACRMPFEEPLLPEPHSDTDYGLSPAGSRGENGMGRLVSFNSLGSLSAASSNYSSLSLRDGEREREEEISEMNDGFLHCSPQLVLQQSLEEVAPLRESTDLLDISNFTPDKFRHSSLSEMSPPDTPSPSPQLLGNCGKGGGFPETGGANVRWNCSAVQQLEQDASGNTNVLQTFTEEDEDEGLQGNKGSKKKGGKNGQNTKKSKTPRASKGERAKLPRQGSRSARKIKALLEGKAAKGEGRLESGAPSPTPSLSIMGTQGEWPNAGGLSDDDQGEFQEPSNILSNIVSGMAEVQRFMRASVEPLWGPCLSPGQHALQSQTLKILGSSVDLKKRGGSSGASRGRKGAGRGGKTSPKLLTPGFFPPLGLDCLPLPHRPAHKKMYRHKSTAKFARDELLTGKRDIKGVALTALVEKRSSSSLCVQSVSEHHRLKQAQHPALSLSKWLPSVFQGLKVVSSFLC